VATTKGVASSPEWIIQGSLSNCVKLFEFEGFVKTLLLTPNNDRTMNHFKTRGFECSSVDLRRMNT